ncbi:MAG: hypothetical protein KH010_09415 [Hungatella hathewayi]|nr:hypothetical protein [Hungatella hathewayi]
MPLPSIQDQTLQTFSYSLHESNLAAGLWKTGPLLKKNLTAVPRPQYENPFFQTAAAGQSLAVD